MIRDRIAAAICDHDIATCLLRDAHYADADEVMAGLDELLTILEDADEHYSLLDREVEWLPWLADYVSRRIGGPAIVEAMKGEPT